MKWRIVFSGGGDNSSDVAPFCGAGGSLSDGIGSCSVLMALYQMAHRLIWCWRNFQASQRLVWCWWCFIIWHTVSYDACSASSEGASFLVLMAIHWVVPSCVVLVALHQMTHLLFWWWLFIRWRKALLGGCGALSDGTHFCLALVTLLSCMAT